MHLGDVLHELTIKDVTNLIELIDKVQKKGHYVSFDLSNHREKQCVDVYFRYKNNSGHKFDYIEGFELTHKGCDIDTYHNIILFFTKILEEEREMSVEDIEKELGYKIRIVGED